MNEHEYITPQFRAAAAILKQLNLFDKTRVPWVAEIIARETACRDMLKALEAIVHEYGRDPETVHIPPELVAAAEDAIDKATGGQT